MRLRTGCIRGEPKEVKVGRERDEFHQECVEQRFNELLDAGHGYSEANRLAEEQIVHDHDPRDED